MRNFDQVETWSFMVSPTICVDLNFYGTRPTAADLSVLDQYLAIAEHALSTDQDTQADTATGSRDV